MEENKIVIYQTEDGQTQIDVRLENETVWLTQAQMAELFQKDRTVITRHINNVFKEGELEKEEVCAKIAHTTRHGAIKGKQQIQEILLYNLDCSIWLRRTILSVMATSALPPHCSCGSLIIMVYSTAPMAQNAWLIIPS